MQRRTSGHSYTTSARATREINRNDRFRRDFAATNLVAVLIFAIFVQWVPRGGLFDWPNGPVMSAGMISPLDPELVHITDDLNEAVDIALSGLM